MKTQDRKAWKEEMYISYSIILQILKVELVSLCTTYVDYALYTRNEEFQEPTKKTKKKLKFKKENTTTCRLLVLKLKQMVQRV